MARYLVASYLDGKEATDGFYITDNRQEAINQAIASADRLFSASNRFNQREKR